MYRQIQNEYALRGVTEYRNENMAVLTSSQDGLIASVKHVIYAAIRWSRHFAHTTRQMCIYSHDNQTHDEFHHANAAAGKSYFAAIRHAISQYAPTSTLSAQPCSRKCCRLSTCRLSKVHLDIFFEFNNNILYFTFKLILVFLNQWITCFESIRHNNVTKLRHFLSWVMTLICLHMSQCH